MTAPASSVAARSVSSSISRSAPASPVLCDDICRQIESASDIRSDENDPTLVDSAVEVMKTLSDVERDERSGSDQMPFVATPSMSSFCRCRGDIDR